MLTLEVSEWEGGELHPVCGKLKLVPMSKL